MADIYIQEFLSLSNSANTVYQDIHYVLFIWVQYVMEGKWAQDMVFAFREHIAWL